MTPQNQEEKIEIDFFKFSIPLGGKEQENKTKMRLTNLLQTTIYILMTSFIITVGSIIYYCFLAKNPPNSTKIQYLCFILIISFIALLLSFSITKKLNISYREILKPKGKGFTNNFLLNTLIILVLTSAYTYKELPFKTATQESEQQYITENIKEIKEKLKENKNTNTSEIINKLDELNYKIISNATDDGNFITYLITCFMSAFLLYLPAAWFFAKKDIEEYLDKIDKNLVTTSENNNSLNSQN